MVDYHVQRVRPVGEIPPHPHVWRIESPNGPTSEGFCRLCNATKTFFNSAPEADTLTIHGGDPDVRFQGVALSDVGMHVETSGLDG